MGGIVNYWQYDDVAVDVAQMLLRQVDAEDIRAAVNTALADDDPASARMYLRFATRLQYPVTEVEFATELARLESPLHTTRRSVSGFMDGFVFGEGDSQASFGGAIAADFTVVGDARDLWQQYQSYQQGQPVNELITVLAGVGIGLTVVTLSSGGAVAPVKTGVSTTKIAVRSKNITPAFQKVLLRQGKEVFDYQKFLRLAKQEENLKGMRRAAIDAYNPQSVDNLQQSLVRINNIRQLSSTGDVFYLLRYVENISDLQRIEKITLKYGAETKAVLKFLGKSAIGSMRVLRKSVGLIYSCVFALCSFVVFSFAYIRI